MREHDSIITPVRVTSTPEDCEGSRDSRVRHNVRNGLHQLHGLLKTEEHRVTTEGPSISMSCEFVEPFESSWSQSSISWGDN